PRGRHGETDARSSTTNATRGFAWASWNFLLFAKPWPPMSIVSSSGLYRKPTGTACGWPEGPTVAIRPSRWLPKYAISVGVKMLIASPHLHPRFLQGALHPRLVP